MKEISDLYEPLVCSRCCSDTRLSIHVKTKEIVCYECLTGEAP